MPVRCAAARSGALAGTGLHHWLLDGRQIAAASARKRQSVTLREAGMHSIAVIDAAGHYDSLTFQAEGF